MWLWFSSVWHDHNVGETARPDTGSVWLKEELRFWQQELDHRTIGGWVGVIDQHVLHWYKEDKEVQLADCP